MCSVGDDVFDEESNNVLQKVITNQKFNKCNKCKEEAPCVLLRKKDAYCKQCFLVGTTHKFKAQLGKSKLIRPDDRVLVSYRIGQASTALLHFLRVGLDLNTPKKIRFQPIILFINDIEHVKDEDQRCILAKIEDEIKSFGFNPHFVSFSQFIECGDVNDKIIHTTPNETICSNIIPFSKIANTKIKEFSNTNATYLKKLFWRQLLMAVAKYFGCKFIFTTEISVNISAQLLTNVCLGKGSHIPFETGFCDDREDEIKILRPLRTFDNKELAFYNHFSNLEAVSIQEHDVNPYSSVQSLLLKFVKDLQVDYPATITTVLKTGDKIVCKKSETRRCQLCLCPRSDVCQKLPAEESTSVTADYSLANHLEKLKLDDLCYTCRQILM